MKSRLVIIGGAFLLLVGILQTPMVSAATDTFSKSAQPTSLLINCDKAQYNSDGTVTLTNECTIDDFFNQFVVLAQFGLNIVSVLGVLMFIFGGFQWITAGGRSAKIDEGKRIIVGTIVGITISFAAFVIINFTISAITGTTARSLNPFGGPIATLFAGKTVDNKSIESPFNGLYKGIDNLTDCHTTWDNCTNQLYCADTSRTNGPVRDLQTALRNKGCGCEIDGCFGDATAICVRNFQLANDLPPTGFVDDTTKNLALGVAGKSCGGGTTADRITKINAVLPSFDLNKVTSISPLPATNVTGCCVFEQQGGSAPVALYCADGVSQRTCIGSGSDLFIPNDRCQNNEATKEVCGFCAQSAATGPGSNRCFQQASPTWCSDVAKPALNFNTGSCLGNGLCSAGCQPSLYITP